MDSISSMLSSSVDDLALLKLDADSKLENLTKLVHFLSGKPQLILTRYEVYVTVTQEKEKNPSTVCQYNCYIIKEGHLELNEESLRNKKSYLETSACQTESESLILDNSISLNFNGTKVKVDPSEAESHCDKVKVLESNVTLSDFQGCCEIKERTDKRNSADQNGKTHSQNGNSHSKNGNSHSQNTDHSYIRGTAFNHILQDFSASQGDMTICDADFELDQKPIITSDGLIQVDTAVASEISSTLAEPRGGGDKQFKCLECGMAFLKAESLIVHEISHATKLIETSSFHCPLCVYKIKSKSAMRDHAKEKHQMAVYLCKGCKFVALSLQQLGDHKAQNDYHKKCVMVSSIELSGQYICSSCHYAAPDLSALSRHMIVHEKKTFQCQHCFLRFKTAEHLSAHSAAHEIAKPHQCVLCSYITHSKFLLASHTKKRHHCMKGKIKCNHCGLEFTNRYLLKDHAQTVHNSQDRFFCSDCTFTCPDLKTYKQHVQGHTGKELLICNKCDYTAFVQSEMYKHQLVHRRVAHQCCKCGRLFLDKGNLTKHMVTHREQSNFQCETCGFRTKADRYLKQHQKLHAESKSYKCDLCDYSTRYSSNLSKHVQTHCAEKPFSCHLCYYTCRSMEALKKHRKRKHKLLK